MNETRGPDILQALYEFSENASPIDFILIARHWDMFLSGIGYTLVLVAVALVVGGSALAAARGREGEPDPGDQSNHLGVRVRGFAARPLLVQLYLIYYGLGQFEAVRESVLWPILRDPLWCTLIAFVLNTAAYTTEIFRGAIEAIPYGEVEAAKAYGMSGWKRSTRIVLSERAPARAARVLQRGHLHAARERGGKHRDHRRHPRSGTDPQCKILCGI